MAECVFKRIRNEYGEPEQDAKGYEKHEVREEDEVEYIKYLPIRGMQAPPPRKSIYRADFVRRAAKAQQPLIPMPDRSRAQDPKPTAPPMLAGTTQLVTWLSI